MNKPTLSRSPIEAQILQQLGVPDDANGVLLLGMDAHLDWDWLSTFQNLLVNGNGAPQGSVQTIMTSAWSLMASTQVPAYYYSVCEMGFLRAAIATVPSLLPDFQNNQLVARLGLEGGGLTSPDNLLPHGEAFIRTYLVGQAWQQATLGLSTTFAHLPDDFGHDAQLPVMLEAMGFAGVCFSRVPGSDKTEPLDKTTSLYGQLMAKANDFVWQASDGAQVLAHLLPFTYSQGQGLVGQSPSVAVSLIDGFLAVNQPGSPTPYVYVPCGDDFALPITNLVDQVTAWNQQRYSSGGTYGVVATLDQYMRLVAAWAAANPEELTTLTADPTPYWTGFYASRPAHKILHQAAVRALLGAEVYSAIADALQTADAQGWQPLSIGRQATIAAGWEALLPSTHHDYITGTAVDSVTSEEQLPLLRAAVATARGVRTTAVQSIVTMVGASPQPGEVPVAILNQLGFARSGVVALDPPRGPAIQSVRFPDGTPLPVQVGADGRLCFPASAPALGYTTAYLSTTAAAGVEGAKITDDGNGLITLRNGLLQACLSQPQYGAIATFQAVVEGSLEPDVMPSGGQGTPLVFFADGGNIYNFGNELDTETASYFPPVTGTLTAGDWVVRERGPWRVRVELPVSFDDGQGSTARYTLAYTLVDGEPFLRIACIGAAPLPDDPANGGTPYAVCLRFPLASGGAQLTVDGVVRGTPYHWHDQLPVAYWPAPTFQATHHFVLPSAAGTTLAAIYHADVPAWGIDGSGAMLGCILRNTPGMSPWPSAPVGRGANGVDFGTHSRELALRVPAGLPAAPALLPVFQESLGYQVPLRAAIENVPITGVETNHPVKGSFPTTYSLVTVTSGNAIVTAVKAAQDGSGQLVLRLYQPSKATVDVILAIAGAADGATLQPLTALEQPLDAPAVTITGGTATVTMTRALATFALVLA